MVRNGRCRKYSRVLHSQSCSTRIHALPSPLPSRVWRLVLRTPWGGWLVSGSPLPYKLQLTGSNVHPEEPAQYFKGLPHPHPVLRLKSPQQ